VLNSVPHHEDISLASLRTTQWRYVGDWRYSSMHS